MTGNVRPQNICDDAALYVLNALDEPEQADFESHLESCGGCKREVESLRRVAQNLDYLAPQVSPPSHLRQRITRTPQMAREVRQADSTQTRGKGVLLEADGLLISRPAERDWAPLGISGISQKQLFIDTVRKYRTTLFRMEAGASFPSHEHGDAEELFVLEGDLTVNDVRMVAGDYCRAATGSLHGVATTERGCVVLVLSSELDKLTPARL